MATLGFDPNANKKAKSPWDIGSAVTGAQQAYNEYLKQLAPSAGGMGTAGQTTVNAGQPHQWQTADGGSGATTSTTANQGQGLGTARQTTHGSWDNEPGPGMTGGAYGQPAQAYTPQQSTPAPYTTLPSGARTDQAPGMSYVNGKWQEVNSGADVVWDSGSDTYYYHGQPLSQQQFAALRDYGPQGLGGTGRQSNYLDAEDVERNVTNLGFGQMPTAYQVPQIGAASQVPTAGRINTAGTTVAAPGQIVAPHVGAEQGGFQDFDALERSIYKSNFDPVNRELERQRGMADEQLAAQLAQAGIAESGTGVGQRQRQADEYYRKQIAASEDAASKAAQQRYGMEYEQSMKNAEMRQQANLANAGFDMQAQVQNAQNLLTTNVTNAQIAAQLGTAQAQMDTQASIAGAELGQQREIAQAQMYLSTMGLNFQQAQAAQRNYLDLLGLQEQDMARMDQHELDTLSLWYNTYLKEFAIMVQAGQQSTGKTDQSSSSSGFDVQL